MEAQIKIIEDGSCWKKWFGFHDCNDDDELWVMFKTVKLRMSDKEIMINANGLINTSSVLNP